MAPKRPNVVVFFTDQQRWDASGLHGNPLDIMPNFDRMAKAGTHLFNTFTSNPVCGPARACLQTGTYCSTNGVMNNSMAPPDAHLPRMGQLFRDAGYDTAYVGKWHLATHGHEGPVPEEERGGYRHWLAANMLEFVSEPWDTRLYNENGDEVKLPGYRVDAMTDAAIRYIDDASKKDDPFFLFISYLEPHHQNFDDDYPAPPGYQQRYDGRWIPPDLAALPGHHYDDPESPFYRLHGGTTHPHLGGYWGMIKRLDEAFGRMNDALQSLGIADDTIVLFTSDHGCHFRTRNSEYKRSCHDSSIRVPTMITGPGFMAGGQRQELVSLVDLPPTLLDAAGIDIPEEMQGRSILQRLRGGAEDWPDDAFVQLSEQYVGRVIRTHRWKYCVMTRPDEAHRRDRSHPEYDEAYLYDLAHDPYELVNLINSEAHEKVREVMRDRLTKRMTAIGEPAPKITPVPQKKMGQRTVKDADVYQ